MYSFSYLEPVCCSMSSSNCCFLTCTQISQESGKVIWHSHLLRNFLQFVVIHTVEGFSIVKKAVDAFLEFPCFFYDQTYVGNLIPGSSAFSKFSLYIWKSSIHVLLKLILKDFKHNLAGIWNDCNCTVIWTFFGIAFLWYWNKNWPSPFLIYLTKHIKEYASSDKWELFFHIEDVC